MNNKGGEFNGDSLVPQITRVLSGIVDNPKFPTERLEPNCYRDKTDAEVRKLYAELAQKWRKVILDKQLRNPNKSTSPRGLSLDNFVTMVNEFFGKTGDKDKKDNILNRDILNRTIHTGDRSVQVRAKKVDRKVLKIMSYFSDYSAADLEYMAEEALAICRKLDEADLAKIEESKNQNQLQGRLLQFPQGVLELHPESIIQELNHESTINIKSTTSDQIKDDLEPFSQSPPLVLPTSEAKAVSSAGQFSEPFSSIVYKYTLRHGAEKIIYAIKTEKPDFNDVDAKALLLDILLGKDPRIKVAIKIAGIVGVPVHSLIDLMLQ